MAASDVRGARSDLGALAEVFVSVQGEGLLAGRRQLFLRLAGCAVGCRFCDTPDALERGRRHRWARPGGAVEWGENPVSAAETARRLVAFARRAGRFHSLSVTGGEPLEQPEFLAALLERLAPLGWRVMLETAGLHARALARVIERLAWVSMDVKLPSVAGVNEAFGAHARFLAVARRRPTWVKMVVNDGVTGAEVRRAAEALAAVDPRVPLFLQPETRPDGRLAASCETLETCFALAAEGGLRDVRVLPQVHRFLGVP